MRDLPLYIFDYCCILLFGKLPADGNFPLEKVQMLLQRYDDQACLGEHFQSGLLQPVSWTLFVVHVALVSADARVDRFVHDGVKVGK